MRKLALVLLLFAIGCSQKQFIDANPSLIPPNASKVTELGDRWVSFEIDGQKFYMSGVGNDRVCFPVGDCKCK